MSRIGDFGCLELCLYGIKAIPRSQSQPLSGWNWTNERFPLCGTERLYKTDLVDQKFRPATISHQEEIVVGSLFEGDAAKLPLACPALEEDNEVSWFADFLRLGVAYSGVGGVGQVHQVDDVPLVPVSDWSTRGQRWMMFPRTLLLCVYVIRAPFRSFLRHKDRGRGAHLWPGVD